MSMSEQPDLHRLHTDLEVLRERVSGLEQGRFEALEAKLDAARAEWQGFRGEFDAKLEVVRAEGLATRDEFSAKFELLRQLMTEQGKRLDRLEQGLNESRRWLIVGMSALGALIVILRFAIP